MSFSVDSRITSSCIFLKDWPLSRIFLKNNAEYPWFILVPRQPKVQALDDLSIESQLQIIQEITKLSQIIRNYYQPKTLNVGALGNIVSQLHIHVIARFDNDSLWPHGVWQESLTQIPYTKDALSRFMEVFVPLI